MVVGGLCGCVVVLLQAQCEVADLVQTLQAFAPLLLESRQIHGDAIPVAGGGVEAVRVVLKRGKPRLGLLESLVRRTRCRFRLFKLRSRLWFAGLGEDRLPLRAELLGNQGVFFRLHRGRPAESLKADKERRLVCRGVGSWIVA